MASTRYKEAFNGRLQTYVSLDDSAGAIIRQLTKTANADLRAKLVQELRSLDKQRLELLDQMDALAELRHKEP